MPPAGSAETTESRTGDSSTTPVAPRSRKGLASILSSASRVDWHAWSPLLTFIAGVVAPLLAVLAAVYVATPVEERRVSISDARIAERRLMLPDDGGEVMVITFKAEAVGYPADPITVATLWLDPVTGQRIQPTLKFHGNLYLVSSIKTNQSIGWLEIPYPTLPHGVRDCLVLRVLLLLAPEEGLDLTQLPRMVKPTQDMPLLAYTDTPPFEPYEDGSCAALDRMGTPETG